MSKFQTIHVPFSLHNNVNHNSPSFILNSLVGLQEICNKLVILVNGQVQLIETMETVRKTLLNEYMLTFTLRAEDDGSIDIQAFSEFCTEIEATKNLIFHDEKSVIVISLLH